MMKFDFGHFCILILENVLLCSHSTANSVKKSVDKDEFVVRGEVFGISGVPLFCSCHVEWMSFGCLRKVNIEAVLKT